MGGVNPFDPAYIEHGPDLHTVMIQTYNLLQDVIAISNAREW